MDNAAVPITVQSGNASLQVYFYPRPGSETIILLHGGPGVPDEMTEVRDWLCLHMQVIYFDQRGIGMNDNSNCSFKMANYIDDVTNITTYFQIEKFHIFGHSWGGLYAQLYAHENPTRILSLFLCSPASGTGRIWSITEREIFHYNYSRSTLGEWIGMGINTLLGMLGNRKAYKRLFRQIIINYHKGYPVNPPDEEKLARINSRAGMLTRKEIKCYPRIGSFGKTPYPVMITYGQFDAYTGSKEYIFERFRFAHTAIIPGSGHTPWKHNWPRFLDILSDFYQKT